MKKTLFERSYDYLVKQGCTIWEGKDKQTDPINYPKNLGNYKYIVIMDGDITPILTTNLKKDVIQLAKDLKKDLEEINMANKDELLNKLIDYLKEHYDCSNQDLDDEFGFGMITLTNNKGEKMYIAIDEDVIGCCDYYWCTSNNHTYTHSNFSHMVNTVIRIFMMK